jgi:transcriptional antiterminator NusG
MGAEEVRTDLELTEVQSEAEEIEVPGVAENIEAAELAVAAIDSAVEIDETAEEIAAIEASADVSSADDEEAPEETVVAEDEVIEDEGETEDVVAVAESPMADDVATEIGPLELDMPDDGRAWYVIHCYSGYEAKVKHNLEQRIETMQMQDQIFQVVVPTEDEIEVRDGKRRVVERRVFPGYILVQMLLNDDSWYVVRNTPGVTGFVGMGNEPTPLRPEEVQGIMRRMEAEAPKIKVTFRQGQKVRIIDGPFNEFIGVVDEIDMERAKVRVLVSFFGRETPVELDFLQVEKT